MISSSVLCKDHDYGFAVDAYAVICKSIITQVFLQHFVLNAREYQQDLGTSKFLLWPSAHNVSLEAKGSNWLLF